MALGRQKLELSLLKRETLSVGTLEDLRCTNNGDVEVDTASVATEAQQ